MKKTILIFGVSSFVGSNLVDMLKDEYRIVGTYHKTPVAIEGITCIPCDVLKRDHVSRVTAFARPDVSIYAVGLSSLKASQLYPKKADALNSVGAINCCQATERVGGKFVYLSSGYVLSGQNNLYHEGETPIPNTAYGTTVSSTEFFVQRSNLNYLILRCSPLYGRSYNPLRPSWFETLQSSLARNQTVQADDFVHTGHLDIQVLVYALKAMLTQGVTNRLFHVSSSDFMTRFEFARTYAKIFKKDESLIQKINANFPSDRKADAENAHYYFRLATSNIEAFLNSQMPSIKESLEMTYTRFSA